MSDHMPLALENPAYPQHCAVARLVIARHRTMVCLGAFLIASCILFSVRPVTAFAAEAVAWKAVIADHQAIPPYLIAVDKSRQELAFFERRSPLKISRRFACTTGQAVGDKALEGDLKTPEGIYFVGYRIGSGLDFIKYGYEAYTLNYPNPVDRLRKKTGYGIWIHGRGETLMPLQTEGCVSMNNEDLALLGKALVPGAPVALTGTFVYEPAANPEDEQTFLFLRDRVEAWAKAWSDRSREYFGFYDKNAYSIAQGEPFSSFQAQKERIFAMLPWIRTTVRDIQVLRGPDYWVTWFYQDYQAPNLQTRGVRRLYWGKDDRGEFKILGMEWHPGLNTTTLLASADHLLPPLEQQGPVWPDGIPDTTGKGGPLVADIAEQTTTPVRHEQVAQATDQSTQQTDGSVVTPSAPSPASSGTSPVLALASPREIAPYPDHRETFARGAMARPSLEAIRIGRELNGTPDGAGGMKEAPRRPVEGSRPQSASAKDENAARPERKLPPALPAQRVGGAAESPLVTATVVGAPLPRPTQGSDANKTAAPLEEQPAPAPAPAPAPESPPLTAEPAPAVADMPDESERKPSATDNATLAASEDIASRIEEWRQVWQSGDIELYMAFYAPQAKQGSRGNATSIRKQKSRLWSRAAPATVELADISVSLQGKTASAVMRQTYRDSHGKGDYGRKELTFRNINGVWFITQEDWSPLPDETGH